MCVCVCKSNKIQKQKKSETHTKHYFSNQRVEKPASFCFTALTIRHYSAFVHCNFAIVQNTIWNFYQIKMKSKGTNLKGKLKEGEGILVYDAFHHFISTVCPLSVNVN